MPSGNNNKSKAVPQHAYSISIGLTCAAAGVIARQLSDDPYYQVAAATAALLAFGHGAYSLYQEGRLKKAGQQISNKFYSLWNNKPDTNQGTSGDNKAINTRVYCIN